MEAHGRIHCNHSPALARASFTSTASATADARASQVGEWANASTPPLPKGDQLPPSFRPDLALKRDQKQTELEKLLKVEASILSLSIAATDEAADGEQWDEMW